MRYEIVIKKLRKYFEKEKDICLAYLFGSTVLEKKGPLSDTDIAVFLNAKSEDRELEVELKLISDLTDILGDKVDIVIMNSAPPLLKYNIIKNGKLLKGSNDERALIEYKIMNEYLDTKYLLDRHSKRILQEISQKGLL